VRRRTALTLPLAAAAACSKGPRLAAGSKNFTEQLILGEIAAQRAEARVGLRVARKLNLGGTLLAQQALESGQIDFYPEYTGTALLAILKEKASTGAAGVLERVRTEYRRRWNLVWMEPFGFQNTFAMAVRGEDARGIATLSEAALRERPWRLGAGYEFAGRADGLPGLLKTYPLRLAGPPVTMDLGLLYRALEQKQVDMVAANSTDGMLSVLDVKVLRDDRAYFPPYQAALIVRADSLARLPGLEAAFTALSGRIAEDVMRRLNHEVDGKHQPPAEVARQFLAEIS
jgi:osmoprotectant transport system substrate-binding protein